MDEEEVVLLEEQLAAAHAEVARLQSELTDLTARQTQQDEALQSLRAELEASRSEAGTRGEELQRLEEVLAASETQGREALTRYRELVLEREPHLPGDLVAGSTVAELDEAVERARETVAQVRRHLDQQAQALRVPAGAPARTSADLSQLSAAEKIRLGLSRT